MATHRVLSVGQCSLDHGELCRLIEGQFDAAVATADDSAEAIKRLSDGPWSLVLVNRVLDRTQESGVDLIRRIKTTPGLADVPVMLVSNYPEAQQGAQQAGAEPGFGKSDLNNPQVSRQLARHVGQAAVAGQAAAPPSVPLAFRNGQLIDAHELSVPVTDAGFVQGVTVAEQLRTFNGRLFRLDEHLQRLHRSLAIVGVDAAVLDGLKDRAGALARHNHALIPAGSDLGLSVFVTPGPYAALDATPDCQPLVAMHTFPLAFHLWAAKYDQGQALAVVSVQQVPNECWPAELKCRSRMHYYLADREASRRQPGARALLLDSQRRVIEASTANVVVFRRQEGIISPPRDRILQGISVSVVAELAEQLGIEFLERDLSVDEVVAADEVWLSSTSMCTLPVVSIDEHPIGEGCPGPVYQQLLQAWNALVGLDLRQQALSFGQR